jgi:heavy metal translocating P-type ATPase
MTVEGSASESFSRRHLVVAALALAAIVAHLVLRFVCQAAPPVHELPLIAALVVGGVPLVWNILRQLLRREWGADLIAALSIITALLVREYLAGAFIVLMLASGDLLEHYAVHSAASVLRALARRMPSVAHRKADGHLVDAALEDIAVGETLVILPHEICPVDGIVLEGHGAMDESFLTGEPFHMSKAPGATVISGAVNGEAALTMRATQRAVDSRYAKIMEVMRASEQHQPRLRRLADQLGMLYTPLALGVAGIAWALSGSTSRFLAVLVVATPCPMLIGIPVAIIGAVSLCAKRSIIVKKPVVLEQIAACTTAIFDKTGTLTYGEPYLSEAHCAPGISRSDALGLAASLEQYSKHPLARAVLAAAGRESVAVHEASQISEMPGEGLRGVVAGQTVRITSRGRLIGEQASGMDRLPAVLSGLECLLVIEGRPAAAFHFRDEPRAEGPSFIAHLGPKHKLSRVLLVSGDREAEVAYLARQVGIVEVFAQQSPEDKLAIVRRETARAKTVFVGDGINDAPALLAATVGIAVGQRSDITSEAAGVVIMDSSLEKLDEFMHISARMRRIAVQSAVGGMLLSLVGMAAAAVGWLSPVMGAMAQELIDIAAVFNALRAALPPKALTDYQLAEHRAERKPPVP